jgi:hydrogenase expression/formation protein HypC
MCLAVPGRILQIDGDTARVDFGGVTREANVTLVPEAAVDSYVLVHAGFAIQVLNEAEAEETLDLFRQLAEALDGDGERRAVEPDDATEPKADDAAGTERGGE